MQRMMQYSVRGFMLPRCLTRIVATQGYNRKMHGAPRFEANSIPFMPSIWASLYHGGVWLADRRVRFTGKGAVLRHERLCSLLTPHRVKVNCRKYRRSSEH